MTQPCPICATYARLRGPRIKAEIRKTTTQRDRAAAWAQFMAGVHQRHLAPGRITRRTPVDALASTIDQPEEAR